MPEQHPSNNRNYNRYTDFLGMAHLANHLSEEMAMTNDGEEKFDNNVDSLLKEARKKKKQLQNRINAKRKKIEEGFES